MMHTRCKCFHHTFAMILVVVGGLAAVLFFWSAVSGSLVLGFDDTFYFEAVIVLAVAMHGAKFCSCCRGHGMGYKNCESCNMVCEECMPEKEHNQM
jgi:hypothetical protein